MTGSLLAADLTGIACHMGSIVLAWGILSDWDTHDSPIVDAIGVIIQIVGSEQYQSVHNLPIRHIIPKEGIHAFEITIYTRKGDKRLKEKVC